MPKTYYTRQEPQKSEHDVLKSLSPKTEMFNPKLQIALKITTRQTFSAARAASLADAMPVTTNSPPEVDRIWGIWGSYIHITHILYTLIGNMSAVGLIAAKMPLAYFESPRAKLRSPFLLQVPQLLGDPRVAHKV